jgi:hypothetical protein
MTFDMITPSSDRLMRIVAARGDSRSVAQHIKDRPSDRKHHRAEDDSQHAKNPQTAK